MSQPPAVPELHDTPSTAQQPLTKNQRKKRRKLLGKLFLKDKRDSQQGGGQEACMHSLEETECSEASFAAASDISAAVVSSAAPRPPAIPASASAPAQPTPHASTPASRKRRRGVGNGAPLPPQHKAHHTKGANPQHPRPPSSTHAASTSVPGSRASSASRLHVASHPRRTVVVSPPPVSTVSASLVSNSTAAAEVVSAPAPAAATTTTAAAAELPCCSTADHTHTTEAVSHLSEPPALAESAAPAAPASNTSPTEPAAAAATNTHQTTSAPTAAAGPRAAPAVKSEPAEAAARQEEDHEPPEEEALLKKPRRSYVHGNYHGYYGYRLAGEQQEDPRLQVFEEEWFRGKRVLDVGCNVGVVTLAVAVNFHPRSTLGVDIDGKLVKRASRVLGEMRTELTQQLAPQEGYIPEPLSAPPSPPPHDTPCSSTGGPAPTPSSTTPTPSSTGTDTSIPTDPSSSPAPSDPGTGPSHPDPSSAPTPSTSRASTPTPTPDDDFCALPPAPSSSSLQHPTQHSPSEPPSTSPAPAVSLPRAPVDPTTSAATTTATATATTAAPTSHKRPRSDAAIVAAAAQLPASRRPQPGEWKRLRGAVKALGRTAFRREDWGSTPARPGTVDTIMCLSVTKWIHLHSGDEGLKRVFRKFHRTLAPGGLLVVEPQPWKSYRSAMRKQRQAPSDAPPLAIATLDQLQLRPHQFLEFLTREVGFEFVKAAHVDQSAQGFDRPIYVLRRPVDAKQAQGGTGGWAEEAFNALVAE